jgi:ATP-dependent RNA helicase DDX49/DBP8
MVTPPPARTRARAHRFEVRGSTATVASLVQEYVLMPSHVRHCYFVAVLRAFMASDEKGSCIVFTSTCKSCAELSLLLRELKIPCAALHSQMSQNDRIESLTRFKSNYVRVLVATDVASRGLDIAPVRVVLNFNVPKAVDDYIHRVGRTARAGRGGRAVTLMSERDVTLIHAIEAKVGTTLAAYEGLNEDEVLRTLNSVNVARRAVNARLIETDFGVRKAKQKLRAASAAAQSS